MAMKPIFSPSEVLIGNYETFEQQDYDSDDGKQTGIPRVLVRPDKPCVNTSSLLTWRNF